MVSLRILALVAGDPIGQVQPPRIATGENGRAARRANRAGRVGICEPHPFARQPIEIRGFVKLRAVTAEVAPAEVIDEKEHEIGFAHLQRRRPNL